MRDSDIKPLRQEPASEPAPRVLYVCCECGRDVDIHNDITFGRTVDHPFCRECMCRTLYKKRTRHVQMHLAR